MKRDTIALLLAVNSSNIIIRLYFLMRYFLYKSGALYHGNFDNIYIALGLILKHLVIIIMCLSSVL